MLLSKSSTNTDIIALLLGLLCIIGGCRVRTSGQAKSHPEIFLTDHIQYFPDGPKYKLSREEAQLKAARAARNLEFESDGDTATQENGKPSG